MDTDQQEVFTCFHEPQRPETVLLRFPAERKHTILKILYFFLISGLLIKKEAATISSLDFNELDGLFGQIQPASQAAAIIDIPTTINEADIKDIPLLDLPDIPEPQAGTEVSFSELPNLLPNTANKPKSEVNKIPLFPKPEKSPTRIQPLLQEKQKSRWLSISFLSILVASIAIALFFWLNRAPKNSQPEPISKHPAAQTRRKTPGQQGIIPALQKVESESIARKPEPPVLETQEKPPAAKKEITTVETQPNPADSARQAFASGKFNAAGDLWRQELAEEKISFSILLEMDCLEQSVRGAFQQITDKEFFFILNRIKDGRNCWLVLWGKFRTQNEATQNLRLIPEYFFKQSDPPRVIELEPYL